MIIIIIIYLYIIITTNYYYQLVFVPVNRRSESALKATDFRWRSIVFDTAPNAFFCIYRSNSGLPHKPVHTRVPWAIKFAECRDGPRTRVHGNKNERQCYNSNKVYKADWLANKLKESGRMGKSLPVAWGDHEWCQELVARLPSAKNELKFRTSCVAIFGNECCTECRTIGRLFDRMDLHCVSSIKQQWGLGYSLMMDDCLACIEREECENPVRMSWKEPKDIWKKDYSILENALYGKGATLRLNKPADNRWRR